MRIAHYDKFFFLDSNALARFYFDDIGKKNLKYIHSYPNSLGITLDYAVLELYSILSKCFNQGFLTKNEIKIVITELLKDFNKKKIILLQSSSYIRNRKAQKLLFSHSTKQFMGFGSADSLYLAACIDFADSYISDPNKLVFVTSDNPLYKASLKFSTFKSFHFWTCNLGNTYVNEFIPVKDYKEKAAQKKTCPNCKNQIIVKPATAKKNFDSRTKANCPNCNINVCPSTYLPAL